MSMVRDPLFRVGEPAHNLIPSAGNAIWYPLHDSSLMAGIAGLPTLVETVTSGAASGAAWTTPGLYTFPANNGTTNDVVLRAIDDDEDRLLDAQLSLYGMAAGQQTIIACEAAYTAAPGGTATLWCYGKQSGSTSFYSLSITSAEAPQLAYRGKSSSGQPNRALTAQSGSFGQFRGQGIFAVVLGIRPTDGQYADLELRVGNGTLSAYFAATGVDMWATGGTAPPGISGSTTAAQFGGVTLGARLGSAGAPETWWGRGAGNTGAVGNFAARRFGSYSAARVADTLAYLLSRKRDFPRNLGADFA